MTNNDNQHTCPNCDKEFNKEFEYCPHCGQKNSKQRIKLKDFISDYLAANFNFDSKILTTLKLLIFKPAFLTKEFFRGRQTKYIPPIRLYLFISLAYFFIFSLGLPSSNEIVDDSNDNDTIENSIDKQENGLLIDSSGISLNFGSTTDESIDTTETDTTYNIVQQYFKDKSELLNSKIGTVQLYENLKKYLSSGMFFLLPIVALILSLIFYRKKYYIENLLFVIHIQSLIFLIGTFFNLIQFIFHSDWITLIEFVLLVYISFLWLREYYELSIGQTIARQMLFYFLYLILFIIYIISLFFVSLILL